MKPRDGRQDVYEHVILCVVDRCDFFITWSAPEPAHSSYSLYLLRFHDWTPWEQPDGRVSWRCERHSLGAGEPDWTVVKVGDPI